MSECLCDSRGGQAENETDEMEDVLRMNPEDAEDSDDAPDNEATHDDICQACGARHLAELDPADPTGRTMIPVHEGRCYYHLVSHLFIWNFFAWEDCLVVAYVYFCYEV